MTNLQIKIYMAGQGMNVIKRFSRGIKLCCDKLACLNIKNVIFLESNRLAYHKISNFMPRIVSMSNIF
jgi:hypothetical protein